MVCGVDPLRRIPLAQKLVLARHLRRGATPAERHAWSLLRNRRLLGLKFRRQHVLHGFIVDFYCAELRLVVELEGGSHGGPPQAAYDAARSDWLKHAGYHVMRIRNQDLTQDRLGKLIGQIARPAPQPRPAVPPLPKGEGARG
jgi:very-short-patch-repair endonuclease